MAPLGSLALSRSTLDRASHLRADPELVTKLWADPATRVVPMGPAGQAPVRITQPGAGDALPEAAELVTASGEEWARRWNIAAEIDVSGAVFLGVDEQGVSYLALPVAEELAIPEGARWAGLREVGHALDDTGAGVVVAAVAVLAWHVAHPHCSRCGHATDVVLGGWQRHCPNCGAEHYPRTDPAVIMAIVDAEGRILLGRQAAWPERRFSTLAGFVEPGEPLEAAVRREVAEESGVVVGDVDYRGSQPWPFPSSLMLGFQGTALTTEITVDGVELAEAKWWTKEELLADITSGELLLPPAVSIARRLIEDWYGAELPAPNTWR